MRVSETATDKEIQSRLRQLYSTDEMQDKKDKLQDQLTTGQRNETQMMLAIAESTVQVDQETKIQIMQYLMEEDPYADILQQFQDDRQCREIERHDKKYRLKKGSLVLYESNKTQK